MFGKETDPSEAGRRSGEARRARRGEVHQTALDALVEVLEEIDKELSADDLKPAARRGWLTLKADTAYKAASVSKPQRFDSDEPPGDPAQTNAQIKRDNAERLGVQWPYLTTEVPDGQGKAPGSPEADGR